MEGRRLDAAPERPPERMVGEVDAGCEAGSTWTSVALLLAFVVLEAAFLAVADPARHPLASLLGKASGLCAGAFAIVLVVSTVVFECLDAGDGRP